MDQLLRQEVTGVWQRGWQPRDVVWLARTKLGRPAAEALVWAVLAEAASHDGVTLDARWQSQLDDLLRDHPTASADARVFPKLAAYLSRLPTVPRLIPPPGETHGLRFGASSSLDARTLDRVRALLAKAESTDFPEEAESLSAKAQELMARHAIDQVLVSGSSETGEPEGRRIHIDSPYADPKAMLLCEVAEANRCRVVWSKQFQIATVFGFPGDLDGSDMLFTSLLVQATGAMLVAPRHHLDGVRSFRRSFLMAYGARIGERLAEINREAVELADDGSLLPVLASRADATAAAAEAAFPTLGRWRVSHSSPGGVAAGRAAAERADLAQPRVGATTGLLDRT